MSINLGSITSGINNAIKPISPIKIDANSVTATLGNVVDLQFSGLQTPLKTTLANIANGGISQVLVSQFDKLTNPLTSALNQAGFSLGNFNSALSTLTSHSDIGSNGLSSVLNAKPNPLNNFANYTYHIRLIMTTEIQAYNNINPANPNSNSMNKVIIAESGVTAGFNITSLQTSALATAGNKKRNMWTTTDFKMVITEPLGLTLLDQMYNAARELGVINHLRCPYFIEIWFKGYDEAGNILADNLFYSINRVNITDMDAVSTQAGTVYTFGMLGDGGWAEMNQVSTPPANLSLEAATLGEFFSGMELKWNNMTGNVNQDGIQRSTYKFVIPDAWKSWTLRNPDVEKQNARNAPMQAVTNASTGRTNFTISRGQSIESIVDFVVYLCQEAQKWITGETSPAPGASSLKGQGMLRYVTVYPKVEINTSTPQDPVTGDYIRNITYLMIPTESVKMYTDMESVKAAQSATTQQSKFQYLISNNRLAKKYEYIYTGHNTEVLKFDFQLSSMWQIYQPTWVQSNSYSQYTHGEVFDTNSIAFQLVKGLLNRTKLSATGVLNVLDSIANGTGTNILNGVNSFASSVLEAENNVISQFNTQLNNGVAKLTGGLANINLNVPSTSADKSSLFSGGLSINLDVGDITKSIIANAESQLLNNIQKNTTFLSQRQRALTNKYAEDAQPVQLRKSMMPITGAYDPMPTQQQAQQNSDQNKISATQDPNTYANGTGLVGSIISNIYSGDAFQDVTLTISGDPWWLPVGNMVQNNLAEHLIGSQTFSNMQTELEQAVYIGGDNEILFEFRTGVKIDEDTGLAVTSAAGADFFTGLYSVNTVENYFNNGKFTQELYCLRDVLATDTPIPAAGSPTTSRDRQDVTSATPPSDRR